jgi:hypothetical protein
MMHSKTQESGYAIEEIRTIKELRSIFSGEESAKDSWLFLSTGGYHGTQITLDDLESILRDENDINASVNGRYWITILIVYPQKVSASIGALEIPLLKYGEILVDLDDIQWLREKVRETIQEVQISQIGNT